MTYQVLLRRLRKLGFRLMRHGGRHDLWGKPGTKVTTLIPRHRGEIPPGTLAGILRDLGISREDLEER